MVAKQLCEHCVGRTPSTIKHPLHTRFHTKSNDTHVINRIKLILHHKTPQNW